MPAARGQGLVEYGLIIGLLAVALVAVFLLLGDSLQAMFAESYDEGTAGKSRSAISSLMYSGAGSGSIAINCSGSWGMVENNTITATVKDASGAPLSGVAVSLQLMLNNCYLGGVAQGGASRLRTGVSCGRGALHALDFTVGGGVE